MIINESYRCFVSKTDICGENSKMKLNWDKKPHWWLTATVQQAIKRKLSKSVLEITNEAQGVPPKIDSPNNRTLMQIAAMQFVQIRNLNIEAILMHVLMQSKRPTTNKKRVHCRYAKFAPLHISLGNLNGCFLL